MIISGKFGLSVTKKVEKRKKDKAISSFFPCKAGKINEIYHI